MSTSHQIHIKHCYERDVYPWIGGNQRAKLTRILGETALKKFYPRLFKIQYFIIEEQSQIALYVTNTPTI
ncbi:MAG: hypothetical protein L3J75_14645 [Methylococcaceae bacterium]|nr:hypothetical protein [Methylococcaceae bacterium]